MYSIEESIWNGRPIISILENGQPFFENIWNKKIKGYSFGVNKALVIIANIELIKKYVENFGNNILSKTEIDFKNDEYGIYGTYIKHDNFIRSDDKEIEASYLQIKSFVEVNFGLRKAQAFLDLQDDIKNFVYKYKAFKHEDKPKYHTINFNDNNKTYKYIGEVSGSKPHGFGTIYFSQYETFEGEFFHGFRHGYGILTKYNEQFIGEWQANMRHGAFKYITPEIEEEQFWENDIRVPRLTGAEPLLKKDDEWFELKMHIKNQKKLKIRLGTINS